jgi:hypothetical protein
MTFNETDINGFLKQYTGKEVVYCANPGNAGDALIAHTTFQLFEKLDIKLEIIRHEEIVFHPINID